MKYLRLELKVCEGCGALWLRVGSINGTYCSGCSRILAGYPQPKGRHAGGRPRTRLARTAGCAAAHQGGAR